MAEPSNHSPSVRTACDSTCRDGDGLDRAGNVGELQLDLLDAGIPPKLPRK